MRQTKQTKPVCASCGAAFSHNQATLSCKKCGISDETIEAGPKAIRRWKISNGLLKPRASTFNRRRRAHGRPRSKSRVRGGSS